MHTTLSKPVYSIALCLLLFPLVVLVGCSPGHLGGNEIAFIRNGQLWTIDPDGANAFAIVSDTLPVVSYSWSPDHHILVYRSLDGDFAKTAAGRHIQSNPLTTEPGDLPSTINTIGIDGGSPIPIMFSSADIRYSSPFWNTNGTHLIYRQEGLTASEPGAVLWLVSQDDQPGGIAAKTLPRSYSIPSVADTTDTTVGNTAQGVFTTTLAGTNIHYLLHASLPGHPLPATLERLLWQPAHQHPSLLYAISEKSSHPSAISASGTSLATVQLLIRQANGQTQTLTSCQCTQFAWSPDGNTVLYSTGRAYTLFNLAHSTSFTVEGEAESIPYWSPDSKLLILDGLHTLSLISLTTGQQSILLSDADSGLQDEPVTLPGTDALLHPIPNNIWAADSSHFLFLTRGRTLWQGHSLAGGPGLYAVTINAHGQVAGKPILVDSGNDIQAGWSYENANTSFLFA
jgi:hypothetical protein